MRRGDLQIAISTSGRKPCRGSATTAGNRRATAGRPGTVARQSWRVAARGSCDASARRGTESSCTSLRSARSVSLDLPIAAARAGRDKMKTTEMCACRRRSGRSRLADGEGLAVASSRRCDPARRSGSAGDSRPDRRTCRGGQCGQAMRDEDDYPGGDQRVDDRVSRGPIDSSCGSRAATR